MAAGISILNDQGYSQIDENYANLVFVNKGSVRTSETNTAFGTPTIYRGVYTFYGYVESPMVFIRPVGCDAQIQSVERTDTYVRITVIANGDYWIDCFIFGKIPNDAGGNMGLQVFDANGRITFNSNYKPLRIATIVKQADGAMLRNGGGGSAQGNTVFTSVRNLPWGVYAVCAGNQKVDTITNYQNNTTYSTRYCDAFRMTDNGLESTAVPAAKFPASSAWQQNVGGYYMIIKVDGL